GQGRRGHRAPRRGGHRDLHQRRVRPPLPRHARGEPAAPGTADALRNGRAVRSRARAGHHLSVTGQGGSMTRRQVFAGIAALLTVWAPILATAGPATDQLRPEIERVVATLSNPSLQGDGKAVERRLALRAITDGVFDWTEMSRRALGRYWAA